MIEYTYVPWSPADDDVPVDEYFAAEHFDAAPESDDET